jgi:mRNA interferase MazF
MALRYVPEAGDIVWLRFNPQAGHEHGGHEHGGHEQAIQRSALVISPSGYNVKTGLMLCCPMTTQIKAYPFEVVLGDARPVAVLADQIKSLDWVARKARFKDRASALAMAAVQARIAALVGC